MIHSPHYGDVWLRFSNDMVEYLIVGGGGGGGSSNSVGGGGGGGGGGFLTGSTDVLSGSYSIVVGAGGVGDTVGGNSSALSLTSIGGGKGGYAGNSPTVPLAVGGTGGSGGGGGATDDVGGISGAAGSGTVGQGKNGGTGSAQNNSGTAGGGGGGAFAVGGNGPFSSGVGGDGINSSIRGTGSITYGGGGGGGTRGGGGIGQLGGLGGGGSGGRNGGLGAQNGTTNLGGGGGGSGGGSVVGNGGDGVVIIRYPVGTFGPSTGGTVSRITVSGVDYMVHVFTSSGTLVLGSTSNFFLFLLDEGRGRFSAVAPRTYGPEILINGGFVGNANSWDLAEGGIAFTYSSNAVHLPANLDDTAIMWQIMGEITQDALYHYEFDVQYILADEMGSSLDFYLGTESGGADLIFVTNITPNGGTVHYTGDITVPFEDNQETWLYTFIFTPGFDLVSPNLILTNCSFKRVLY